MVTDDDLDINSYKQARLLQSVKGSNGKRGKVGIPLQLSMYEQLPLWAGFFERLGFEVILSDKPSKSLFFKDLPSDVFKTVCYPAKLMHGHIDSLLEKCVDFIFLPCESYNVDENCCTTHYNCSVIAYYSKILKVNNESLTDDNFIMPYIDLNVKSNTVAKLFEALKRFNVRKREIARGLKEGFARLESFHADVKARADEILKRATEDGKQIVVLAGRPYHLDNEINHGLNKLLVSLGVAVLSEDSVFGNTEKVNALNQWTYHERLYFAARFAIKHKNVHLIQLVSDGCGLDGKIADELRSILERERKLYTQIKLDEINNLGAVKTKLKSLLSRQK